MGIRGLRKFICENPEFDFLKSHILHDTCVIVDGGNLLHHLYFSNEINCICGGDYNEYAESVRGYFNIFLECNVKPIVVFDGGYDKSKKKLKTIHKRTDERLISVKNIVQHKKYDEQVLPLLAYEVFICILNELDIPFAVCDFEADDQIAALANDYDCPVISVDSDFFIFDLHNGFITCDSIETTTVILDNDSDGNEYRYLNCRIYYIDKLISCFKGMEKAVLPLFGTLMGNDYVEEREFDKFFANIQLPKNERQKRMIGLLRWLSNKSLDDAITQILQCVKKERRDDVKSIIEVSIASYNLHKCNLMSIIINQKLGKPESESSFTSRLTTACGCSLPSKFIEKHHRGEYSSYFANIIVLHKHCLKPQIDILNSPSSHTCALYIRKVIYGILTAHDVRHEKCRAPKIEEYDRHGESLKEEFVEPVFSLDDIGSLPKINELNELGKEKARSILVKVLDIDINFLTDLPAEWQLFIGTIKYWLCNSDPHCTEAFLYALIVNLIYCDIIKHNNSYRNAYKCCSEVAKNECSSVICVLSRISQSDLLHATSNLEEYLANPSLNRGKSLRLYILHCYSQLQSCLLSAISLNKLLGECVENTHFHRCLNGSLLYNLTKAISTQSNPKLFVTEILGRETTLSALFTLLCSKVCQGVPDDYIIKNTKSKEKNSRHVDSSQESEDSSQKSEDKDTSDSSNPDVLI